MGSIEFFVVLAVAAFDLAVVPGSIRTNELVTDPQLGKGFLKKGGAAVGRNQTVGKFRTVVGLDTFNGERELLDHMAEENGGRIGAVLPESFQIAETAELIEEGVLIPLGALFLPDHAGFGNKLDVDLTALPGVFHLFVGFGDILGVRQLDCHHSLPAQDPVQSGDGTGIASHSQLYPEYHQPGVGISPAHIFDEFEFGFRVLIGVAAGPVGSVFQ